MRALPSHPVLLLMPVNASPAVQQAMAVETNGKERGEE